MKLQVYIDGWCPYCRRFGRWIKRLDIFQNLELKDIRLEDNERIQKEKALKAMASINEKGELQYGFSSIYTIFKTLPLLWVFLPLFFLLRILHIGDFIYNELAIRRKIIPLHCDDTTCQLS